METDMNFMQTRKQVSATRIPPKAQDTVKPDQGRTPDDLHRDGNIIATLAVMAVVAFCLAAAWRLANGQMW